MSVRVVLGYLIVGIAVACGGQSKPAAAPAPDRVSLRIRTTDDANGGTALHVLVRETSKADYPRTQYEDVAASLLVESDPKTLDWLVMLPGQARDVSFERPKGGAVAVYFLFTDPGRRWKELLDDTSVKRVELVVGRDQIHAANVLSSKAVRR